MDTHAAGVPMTFHDRSRPVVVGVDGSNSALNASRWAAVQAARRCVPLQLLYAQQTMVGQTADGITFDTPADLEHVAAPNGARGRLQEARAAVAQVAPELSPQLVVV